MPEANRIGFEVTPGTTKFDKMIFKLLQPINDLELKKISFNGNHFSEVQPGVYAMPAIMCDDLNLFFLLSQFINDDWIIAFSKATVENQIDVTDLSEPIPTGEGLNLLGSECPIVANQILDYFSNLSNDGKGEWRMIE